MPPKRARPETPAPPTSKRPITDHPRWVALTLSVTVIASLSIGVAARAAESTAESPTDTAVAAATPRKPLYQTTVTAPTPTLTVPRDDRAAAASVVLPSESRAPTTISARFCCRSRA